MDQSFLKIVIDSCGELLEQWKQDERFASVPLTLTVGSENIIDDETGDMPFRKEVPMLALKITDQKNFTNKLFLGDTFDLFWLNQAEIITSNVFSIDGKLQTDFFDNDEQEFLASSHRTFSLWKEVKPFCYSVIRGKKAPLSKGHVACRRHQYMKISC